MTNLQYQIVRATDADSDEIVSLWNSMIGVSGCTWSLAYPSLDNVTRDLGNRALWVLRIDAALAGVVAVGDPGDVGELGWNLANPAELARLAVSREFQGQGLAGILIAHALQTAQREGFDGVVLLVSPDNLRAQHLYQKFKFQPDGETFGWGYQWLRYKLVFN